MYIKTMEIINYVIDVFKEALYDVKLQVGSDLYCDFTIMRDK